MGVSLIGEKEKEWILSLSSPVGKGSIPSPSGPVTKLREDEADEEEEEEKMRRREEDPHLKISPSSSHSQHPHHLVFWSNGSPPSPIPPLHLLRTGDEDLGMEDERAQRRETDDGGGGGRGNKKRLLINNETRIPRSSALFSSQESSQDSRLLHQSGGDKQGKGDQGNNTHINPISKSHPSQPLRTSSSSNWNSSNTTTITTDGNCGLNDPTILSPSPSVHEYGLPSSPTPPPRSLNTLTQQHKSTSSRSNNGNGNGNGMDGKWSSRRRLKLRLDMELQSQSVPSLVIPVKGTHQDSPQPTNPSRLILNQPQTNRSAGETLEGLAEGSKWTRNSVTLPVPSPPSASILHSPFPYSPNEAELDPESVGGVSPRTRSRRLISREAQTEESSLDPLSPPPPPLRNREQRKRERRERRQNRISTNPPSPGGSGGGMNPDPQNILPNQPTSPPGGSGDVPVPPPPYSTLPPEETRRRSRVMNQVNPEHHLNPLPPSSASPPNLQDLNLMRRERREVGCGGTVEGPLNPPPNPLPSPTQPLRYHFSHPQTSPHTLHTTHTPQTRRSFRSPRGIPYASEEEPKSCCGMSTSQAVSIRWFIIVIAGIGICSTVAGTALGAARSAGSQHLTLALLMIGVGVVLLTVSAVAWRLTANESGSSSCRAMLGFGRNSGSRGDGGSEPNRVFVPRIPPSYGRPHHPYAAMLYPDFQYRPPPPSYQASMQEYRLRLLLLERSNPNLPHVTHVSGMGSGTDTGFPPTHQVQISHPPPPPYRPYNQNNQNQTLRPGTTTRSGPPPYGRRGGAAFGGSGRTGGLNTSPTEVGPIEEMSHVSLAGGHSDFPHQGQHPSHHRRDSSILSFLSHHSLSEESSEGIGLGNERVGPGVTLMEVNVEMGIGGGWRMDDQLPMTPEDDEVRVGKELSSQSPMEMEEGRGEKNGSGLCLSHVGLGEGEKSRDGNLVRIVQTTDSSQVIGRDIVTVSGTQHNLLLQMEQESHPPSHLSVQVSAGSHPHPLPNNNTNQVQILAHL